MRAYLGRGEEHHSGTFEDMAGGLHLSPPSLIFEIRLPVTRQLSQLHHLCTELTKGLHKLREVRH